MSNKETGGSAFPSEYWSEDGAPINEPGLSIRDYFAAKAMQSFISLAANGTEFGTSHEATNLMYAHASYAMADAMMEARK